MNKNDIELTALYETMCQFGLGMDHLVEMSGMTPDDLVEGFTNLGLDITKIPENKLVYDKKQMALFNNMWITCINGLNRKNNEPQTEDEKERLKEYILNYRVLHNLSRREVAQTFHVSESSITKWEKEIKGKTVTDARFKDPTINK